ncbi:MAG: aquaporin [Nitrososphaerota archaeon]|nr:aquaporin [Nitrososphaerota archaeon]
MITEGSRWRDTFFLIVIIEPITGASFNHARSLRPAIFSLHHTNLCVYLI